MKLSTGALLGILCLLLIPLAQPRGFGYDNPTLPKLVPEEETGIQNAGIMNVGLVNKTTRTNVTTEGDGTYNQLVWTAQVEGMYRLSTYIVTTSDNVLDGAITTTFFWDDETQTQNFAVPTTISLTSIGSLAYADNTFYVKNGGQINVSRTINGNIANQAKYSMYNTVERVS